MQLTRPLVRIAPLILVTAACATGGGAPPTPTPSQEAIQAFAGEVWLGSVPQTLTEADCFYRRSCTLHLWVEGGQVIYQAGLEERAERRVLQIESSSSEDGTRQTRTHSLTATDELGSITLTQERDAEGVVQSADLELRSPRFRTSIGRPASGGRTTVQRSDFVLYSEGIPPGADRPAAVQAALDARERDGWRCVQAAPLTLSSGMVGELSFERRYNNERAYMVVASEPTDRFVFSVQGSTSPTARTTVTDASMGSRAFPWVAPQRARNRFNQSTLFEGYLMPARDGDAPSESVTVHIYSFARDTGSGCRVR